MADRDHFGIARIARGDGVAVLAALEADIGRSFDLVMKDKLLWQSRDGAA